jgi:RNA polymerase sigma-70 factor (ECF subfamily)
MDGEPFSDEYLLARIAAGDAGALAMLYDRYSPAVLAVATLVVGDPRTAEAVVVDTFWEVWQRNGVLPVEGATVRNRLMLYTRQMAQEMSRQ